MSVPARDDSHRTDPYGDTMTGCTCWAHDMERGGMCLDCEEHGEPGTCGHPEHQEEK